jgi:hypothetical protein
MVVTLAIYRIHIVYRSNPLLALAGSHIANIGGSEKLVRADARPEVVSGSWWKKQKASSSSEFTQRTALAGRRVKEDDAYGKGYQEGS